MNSKNIAQVPLNREGALELGLSPCKYCEVGWGSWSNEAVSTDDPKSCYENCEYLKRYMKKVKE